MKYLSQNKGYTLFEVVIFTAVFTFFSTVIVGSLIISSSVFLRIRTERNINNTAIVAVERIVRETRLATDVDILNSTFDSSPGRLTLNTVDGLGVATTIEFYVEDGVIKVKEGGVVSGNLTPGNVVVDDITYRLITNGSAQAVKIEITLHDSRAKIPTTRNFYNTALIRGTY
ncbi:hypothetical protein ACFLY0_01515 [Patescibacteria group bacterium]